MNIDNSNEPAVDTSIDNEPSLDDFEAEFFSREKAPVETPKEEVEDNIDDEENISDDNETDNADDEGEDFEEASDADDEEDADAAPAKKETRAEKRIRELNAKYREEERKRIELEARLAERERLENKDADNNKNTDKEKPTDTNSEGPKAPHWDDEDEAGNKKYPLGQFDPQFNADLVRFTVQEEQRKFEERTQQTEAQRRQQEAERLVQEQWEEKLAPALERYPDYREKGQELIDSFGDLEPAYGKYLTDTIRSIDNGPEVFYHLASNPELARAIVDRGPAMASVELGRLSAQFGNGDEPEPKTPTRTKVTKASPPPPTVRGNATPKVKNLDDLDDFESVFFKK